MALGLATVLESSALASSFSLSQPLWKQVVLTLGGSWNFESDNNLIVEVGIGRLFIIFLVVSSISASLGGWVIAYSKEQPLGKAISNWVLAGWWWWLIPGVWSIVFLYALIAEQNSLINLFSTTALFLFCLSFAGWTATWLNQVFKTSHNQPPPLKQSTANTRIYPLIVFGMIAIYVMIFTTMNWQLYKGLLVPHGDSVMYEEHLWNITHGKGFRSYLDQGLFLGEHIQVVHLLLLPIYMIFPSHYTLELCESFALAITALPLYWITLRHTNSQRLSLLMVATYLLYVPMHYLDIAIDLKTFRPIIFGIPFMLFGIDQYERRRFGWMIVFFLLALSAKEEYAIIIAMFGVWVFFDRSTALPDNKEPHPASVKQQRLLGGCLTVVGTAYLLFAVKFAIPWFRDGVQVHYAAYFGDLGHSPSELVINSFRHPIQFAKQFFTVRTIAYSLSLLIPLGLLPLFSLKRLAVMIPLFGILSLMTIDGSCKDTLMPIHHFHAPLIPIVLWASCAGLGNVQKCMKLVSEKMKYFSFLKYTTAQWAGWFALNSAISIGLFMGMAPNSIGFWDSSAPIYWRSRYIPSRRAEMFKEVIKQIPMDSNVASTDFVHSRFTHYRRSYDYSNFKRKVSNYENKVPDDTDYIVIDTSHRYSTIQTPEQLREIKTDPDQWEVLPDKTEGYFIVLKRR